MKNRITRIALALSLAFALLLSPFGAIAEVHYSPTGLSKNVASVSGEMGVMYANISSITGSCDIVNGKVDMAGTVKSLGRVGTCKVTLTLQKKSGGSWTNDTSWSATGTGSVTKYATKTASPGVFYRLKVTGTVTINGNSETDSIYTSICSL